MEPRYRRAGAWGGKISPKSGPGTATATAQSWAGQHQSHGARPNALSPLPLVFAAPCWAQRDPSSLTLGTAKSLRGLIMGPAPGRWAFTTLINEHLRIIICSAYFVSAARGSLELLRVVLPSERFKKRRSQRPSSVLK